MAVVPPGGRRRRTTYQRSAGPNAPVPARPPTPAPPASPGGPRPTIPGPNAPGPVAGPFGGSTPNAPYPAAPPSLGAPGAPGGPAGGSRPGAAGARPPVNPFPLDPAYTQEVGAANQQYWTTEAGLQYQRGRTQQEYGFDDLSDPYNKASMLERTYLQGQSGMLNTGAARGQLYSGATQSNLDEGGYQYQRDRAGLRREYEDLLHGYTQQDAQARAEAARAVAAATGGAVERGLANRAEDPGQPAQAAPAGSNPRHGKSLAEKLWRAGKGHGPKWRQVIAELGYDPRTPNGLRYR